MRNSERRKQIAKTLGLVVLASGCLPPDVDVDNIAYSLGCVADDLKAILETEVELPCDRGDHEYRFSPHCGAKVCDECNDHEGLARCYCGWARDGGNGRRQLEEMGETIDPEDY
jgi:hypothetical protein